MGTFVSPIDGKTHSDIWTGPTVKTIANPLATTGVVSETSNPANDVASLRGPLTNRPGNALTYGPVVPPGTSVDPGWVWNGEQGWIASNPAYSRTLQTVDPDFEAWNSHFWAFRHPQEYAAQRAASNGGGDLWSMAISLATSEAAMPLWAAAGAYLGGAGSLGGEASAAAPEVVAGDFGSSELLAASNGASSGVINVDEIFGPSQSLADSISGTIDAAPDGWLPLKQQSLADSISGTIDAAPDGWGASNTAAAAVNPSAVNDILGKVGSGLKSIFAGVGAAASAYQTTANNKAQPNLSTSVGGLNLPLLAVGAWLIFKGGV